MNQTEITAIVTVSLLAAFADGDKHERERAEIKRIAEGLSGDEGLHLPTLYQDVLLKRVTLDSAVAGLASNESRQLAYEMAVCVCDADGVQSEAERRFLDTLRTALNMGTTEAAEFTRVAEDMAAAPLGSAAIAPVAVAAGQPGVATASAVNEAELDGARLVVHADGKARLAAGCHVTKGVGHDGPCGGGIFAFFVAQARAQTKPLAVRGTHLQRPCDARVFAFARHVANHFGFSIGQALELDQHVTAPGNVGRAGQVQHQSFATRCIHDLEAIPQNGLSGNPELLHPLQLAPRRSAHH